MQPVVQALQHLRLQLLQRDATVYPREGTLLYTVQPIRLGVRCQSTSEASQTRLLGIYFCFLLSAAAAAPRRELSWLSLTIAPFARWLCTLFRQCQQTVESRVCIPGHNLSVHHGAPQIGCCISTCFLHTGQNRTHKTGRWIGSCR